MTLLDDLATSGLGEDARVVLETYLTERERALLRTIHRSATFGALSREELARRLGDEDGFSGPHAGELELLRCSSQLRSLEEKGLVRAGRADVLLTESGRQVCELLFGGGAPSGVRPAGPADKAGAGEGRG